MCRAIPTDAGHPATMEDSKDLAIKRLTKDLDAALGRCRQLEEALRRRLKWECVSANPSPEYKPILP